MEIKKNIPLAPYTTFKIGGPASCFCIVQNTDELREAVKHACDSRQGILVLGGGSNVLISDKGFDGLAIVMELKGRQVVGEDDNMVVVRAAAGELWDGFVAEAVRNGWWGIENLSHIPGKVAAVAVQNVGAYGQEVSRVVREVRALDVSTLQEVRFNNQDCGFSYRKSIFNSEKKGKFIILSVTFCLQKNGSPNLEYRDLKSRFLGKVPALAEIRQAITEIRDKKYPFPKEAKNGNAGSFFKNVVLDNETYDCVKRDIVRSFGQTVREELDNRVFKEGGCVKVPTAYLMEICGLKSLSAGGAKINQNQPLVIVNGTGTATARDVLLLAGKVRQEIFFRTGLQVPVEPELVGFAPEELSALG